MMSDSLPIEFIHHVSRVTRDLDKSIEFYRDVLGFQPLDRPGFNFRGAWLFNYGLQIHLIESTDQEPPNDEIKARVDHIAFRVSDIDAVQKQLDERGIEFVLLYIPPAPDAQLSYCREGVEQVLEEFELKPEDHGATEALANEYLDAMRAEGVRVVDLRPAFRAAEEQLYWNCDLHINTAGHRVTARELHRALEEWRSE